MTDKPPKIRAPSHLTRAERRVFRDMIEARTGAGKPISAAEVDLIGDYIATRGRIRALTCTWRAAVRREGGFAPSEKHAAMIAKQIDSTTQLARRLARELGLA